MKLTIQQINLLRSMRFHADELFWSPALNQATWMEFGVTSTARALERRGLIVIPSYPGWCYITQKGLDVLDQLDAKREDKR